MSKSRPTYIYRAPNAQIAVGQLTPMLTLLNVATRFVSLATALEMLVNISYAQVDNSASAQNIVIAFYPGVF